MSALPPKADIRALNWLGPDTQFWIIFLLIAAVGFVIERIRETLEDMQQTLENIKAQCEPLDILDDWPPA